MLILYEKNLWNRETSVNHVEEASGMTALHTSITYQSIGCTRILLDEGVHVSQTHLRQTLVIAIDNEDYDLFSSLCDNVVLRSDVSHPFDVLVNGCTPFVYALERARPDIAELRRTVSQCRSHAFRTGKQEIAT